ncbi:hypothetical protein EYC80_008086 [Monilinia laxa]|uniref:ribonuclease H n=1 Tax=Monilinia laxa TaxID=61186 RepID=A0A5N6JV16_MONLA|nr:hypothetical protein EYC80_008086 [Monilinia laxa]
MTIGGVSYPSSLNRNGVSENPNRHQRPENRHGFNTFNEPYGSNGSHVPRKLDPIPTITQFIPPNPTDTPDRLFIGGHRFMLRTNPQEILIYTDGACLGSGFPNSTAGCGFIISPEHKVNFRLENRGPTGELQPQTGNRAELRAVIAALEYRDWHRENTGSWTRLIIATNSDYVVSGITNLIHEWISRGWQTNTGLPVQNGDLWKRLIDQIKKLNMPISPTEPPHGIAVSFWRIPREWNEEADGEAKKGAQPWEKLGYTMLNGVHV